MMNHPPQWQQAADRHTALVDPVVTIQELSRFKPLRTTRIDYALVFTSLQGGLDTYLPPRRPTRTELATRRWTSVYEVDMGRHEATVALSLPSQNDAFLFEVSVGLSWQVVDPAAFVASGERSVPLLVQRTVEHLVRPVLRGHDMEDCAAAELHARKVLEAAGPIGIQAGLDVRGDLQIRRDEATLEQARQLREIAFARQKLEPQHALLLREDELEAERALAQNRQQHEIERERQVLEHERRLVRGRQDLELQEIEAKKIDYYTYYLERGGPAAMAFQLAQRPEDTRLIMENLREDQLRLMENQLKVALQALGGGPGGLEEHQLDEPRRLAGNIIKEVLSAKLYQNADQPPGIEGPAPAPAVAPPSDPAAVPPQAPPPPQEPPVFGYAVPPQQPR